MAFHHVALFFTIIFLWHILANAQFSLESQKQYMSPGKSRNLFLLQPMRSTRKISQRAFQNLDLSTARGYGKRGDCPRGFCGKRMPEFSGARLYGKRDIDVDHINLFIDCVELESKMRSMDYPSGKFRKDEEVILPD
ncbi:hypothetical protein NQ315_004103 [Exocentrus adspersus]|uniref:Uncharacterized protein n=1 Tax=Exocentrus adspersus TaxID=1586481 RepID=A0AAV8W6W1_9CUCU|nr:hypothetical protein NQ315_004103 [Exocentrus adspersus]